MLLFDDPYEQVLETIRDGYPDANKTDLTYDRSGHADFSFRMFRLKKQINTSFDQIASKVTAEILKIPAVRKVAQESGYLNIFLRDEFFLESVDKYLSERKQYPDTFQDPERVLVEHTSTNPTGPIHIGRTRNSIIGDSLARILARYGYRVSTQYFVNDSGKQVAALYKGFKMYHPGEPPAIDSLLSGYQKIYSEIKDDREKEKDLIEPVIKRYESGDSEIIGEIREYCTIVLEGIRKSLSSIGIKIDDYVWESNFLRGTELEAVFEMLDNRLKDENGATYIELDNETKVYLRRSNGTSLYIARDIAYHIFKALNSDW
ncbi:MAG: arginine--tRNA ligase, partial [Candidatus Thermoplasmatota archaeon]|nr:arginine--tRNA ligase [Candidatus Thermoplasmatota archaeon]